MRWRVAYYMVIAAILLSVQAASAEKPQLRVVVLVSPLTPYVAEILKTVSVPEDLLSPGQEPHSFSPTPSQAKIMAKATVLIVPDLEMNPVFAEFARKNSDLKVIELSKLEGADPLPYAPNKWLAGTHDEPTEGTDPHFWLDPERMAALAEPLARELGNIEPRYRETFAKNAHILAVHLRREVIPSMRALLTSRHAETPGQFPFITYHAAYQYFTARFVLTYPGEITARPDEYLGAASLAARLDAAKKNRIRCIIAESRTTLVERIAEASGAKIVLLSPEQVRPLESSRPGWVRNPYDQLLYETAREFGKCL